MSGCALVIINIGERDSAELSRPFMQRYCRKYGHTLIELRQPSINVRGQDDGYRYMIFEKFAAGTVLDEFDRIARLDTDILVSPQAPDVFKAVPETCIGAVYEDIGRRAAQRHSQMERVAATFNSKPWGTRRYFNSGVLVASRRHRDIFRLTREDRRVIETGDLGGCKEQNLCNWKVRECGHALHALDFRFNHLSMFSERWNGSQHRLDSFFIHYAGSQRRKPVRMLRDSRRLTAAWDAGAPLPPWWRRLYSKCFK